jgi:hypothetical protein
MTTEGRRKSRSSSVNSIVMAGLDPAIHVFIARKRKQDVDPGIGERKRRRSSNGYAR